MTKFLDSDSSLEEFEIISNELDIALDPTFEHDLISANNQNIVISSKSIKSGLNIISSFTIHKVGPSSIHVYPINRTVKETNVNEIKGKILNKLGNYKLGENIF